MTVRHQLESLSAIAGIRTFLRLTAAKRLAGWRGFKHARTAKPKRKRTPGSSPGAGYDLPRSLDAIGRALLEEQRADQARRQRERLAALEARRKGRQPHA